MVNCIDCGFLGGRTPWLRNQAGNSPIAGVLIELPHTARNGVWRMHPLDFVCAAGMLDFPIENAGVPVAAEERKCAEFCEWRQGFSPKEHREMVDREELRRWQADREDADRLWRERQDEKRDDRQAALLWQLAGVAGLFTLIGASAGAVIAALLTR